MVSDAIGDQAFSAAVDLLRRCDAVAAAYLLGSAAAGRLRSDSDVDVAVLPASHDVLSASERLALAGQLAHIFGRPVDLGVLGTSNVVYAKEAITAGRRIFERDRLKTARFEMLTLSMYASLQEARREVLRAYAA